MSVNLKVLIGKLNETCRAAASRAASICLAMGHHEVDIEHLLLALLEQPRCDISLIMRSAGVDASTLEADLQAELQRFKTGNSRTPVFSARLPKLFEHAWLIASLDLPADQQAQIRSGHLLQALLCDPGLAQIASRGSRLFGRIDVEQIKHRLDAIAADSQEELPAPVAVHQHAGADPVGELGTAAAAPTALAQFTTNLSALARSGKLDPVIGRELEVRQAIDILMRRRQNNPILTGEAGVGKTAVVEGLALRIASGDVPTALQGAHIHALDMGLLQAGASVKGEFEHRLKRVIEEVKKSAHAIILFIDEAHTMVGAGGAAGQHDCANLLKPALARGELRTIGATTWGEYKKYFEKDAALARRFQVIKVEEPSEELACAMLRAMVPLMEQHFDVRVFDEAITAAVQLSHRYITGRQLPDKAVSVLDTACARVALGQKATPAQLEDLARRIEHMQVEVAALEREKSDGREHGGRLEALDRQGRLLAAQHQALSERWAQERALGDRIVAGRQAGLPAGQIDTWQRQLQALQGETPMFADRVDARVVAQIVSGWTGIPLGKMVKDEVKTVLKLRELLGQRILGQAHAIDKVAQRVGTARAGLDEPDKPSAVFLFVGPSGVGKTEMARALTEVLYGGVRKLVTINMSEYQEAHSVSSLKGAPPGYVGFGEGGVLTEAVRRNPFCVLLLDEIEKAHADVKELFFQVFDKGVMDDAEGCEIDFRNTVIIMTSNAASHVIMQACLNPPGPSAPDPLALEELVRPELIRQFKPAFLGRVQVVPFYPIGDEVLGSIVGLKMEQIVRRAAEAHKADLVYDSALIDAVCARCTEVDSGARNVDNILNGTVLPEIASLVLARMAEGMPFSRIEVTATRQGQFEYSIA